MSLDTSLSTGGHQECNFKDEEQPISIFVNVTTSYETTKTNRVFVSQHVITLPSLGHLAQNLCKSTDNRMVQKSLALFF